MRLNHVHPDIVHAHLHVDAHPEVNHLPVLFPISFVHPTPPHKVALLKHSKHFMTLKLHLIMNNKLFLLVFQFTEQVS